MKVYFFFHKVIFIRNDLVSLEVSKSQMSSERAKLKRRVSSVILNKKKKSKGPGRATSPKMRSYSN